MKYFWYILFIGCLISLLSCRPHQNIYNTHNHSDSIVYKEKLVPVNVPGSNVTTKVNYDSIALVLSKYKLGTKVYRDDPTNSTRLSFWKDSITGKLMESCETLKKQYEAKVTEKEEYIKDLTIQHEKERNNWIQRTEEKIEGLFWELIKIILIVLLVWEGLKFGFVWLRKKIFL
jgi:hypothetical protein